MAKKKHPPRPRKTMSPPPRTGRTPPLDSPPAPPPAPLPAPDSVTGEAETLLQRLDALMQSRSPALAWRVSRQFVGLMPDHPRAPEVRALESRLRSQCEQEMVAAGLPREAAWEVLPHHEMLQALREGESLDEARVLAERVASRWDYVPLLNRLSLLQWDCCLAEASLATARRALSRAPDDLETLAGLVRLLARSGDVDGAAQVAGRLRTLPCSTPGDWVAKAEALDHVDDRGGVLEVFEEADRFGLGQVDRAGELCHLAAASALHLGHESRARRLWKQALQRAPRLEAIARANLVDLARPRHERHAPWVYPLGEWLPHQASRELHDLLHATSGTRHEELEEALREFARRRPMAPGVLARLLKRGDESARQLALAVASGLAECGPMLRDFAVGQEGPDAVRWEAAQAAARLGAVDAEPVAMWMQGAWRARVFIPFEIDTEPAARNLEASVAAGQAEALELARWGRLAEAEARFRALLEDAPHAPELMHNLACTLAEQGRHEEAGAMLRSLHREHPTYLLATINQANLALDRGDIDDARELVIPLLHVPRMNATEFLALCHCQQAIYRARKLPDEAQAWQDWERRFEREAMDDEG